MKEIVYLTEKETIRKIEKNTFEVDGLKIEVYSVPLRFRRFPRLYRPWIDRYFRKNVKNPQYLWKTSDFYETPVEKTPEADWELAGWLYDRMEFKEQLILVLPAEDRETDEFSLRWQEDALEEFLTARFEELNSLCVITELPLEDSPLFSFMEERSGLIASVTSRLSSVRQKGTLLLDMKRNWGIPWKNIPSGCIYLDMTQDSEKERILRAKRPDISYVSARNYLDTLLKNRYNAM